MTLFQILALALAGPIALICLLKMIFTITIKTNNDFGLLEAVLLVVCSIVIIVSFVGFKWHT